MFIVTGASGNLGRKVVDNLLRQVPASEVGVSVRDPSKVSDLAARGVRVRRGDFSDPATLRDAWSGARRLLLISSNVAASGGDPLSQHATAIRAAREVNVERIFYTSQISSSPSSHFPPGRDHAATEKMLAESGIAWTGLRHGFYAASALMMNKHFIDKGELEVPEDGKVSWVTHDDLAAVDASLMTGTEVIDGPTPPLTGSEALALADIAELAGRLLHKPISVKVVSDESMVANARRAGTPQGIIDLMLGYYQAARAGEFQTVDPTLARLLGRPPETMATFLKTNL